MCQKVIRHSVTFLASALLVLLVTSCTKFLSVQPSNVQSVSTYDDVKAILGASIRPYRNGNDWNVLKSPDGRLGVFYDIRLTGEHLIPHFYSDDYDYTRYLDNWAGRNNRNDFKRSLNWVHPTIHEEIWSNYYRRIGFYNMIIQEIGRHSSGDQAKDNIVLCEAKVMRAWMFFRLMRFFSPYHLDQYGLPLNTDPDAVSSYDHSRQTQTENYRFIISELQSVLSCGTEPSPTYNVFFDTRFVHALLAEIYLWKGDSGAKESGDYEEAIKHARYVLSHGVSYAFTDRQVERPSYLGVFKDDEAAAISIDEDMYGYFQNIAGNPDWRVLQYPSKELYDLYQDDDIRKSVYFSSDDQHITKFANSGMSWMLHFGTGAEMQLIIAESLARIGDADGSIKALVDFGSTRYGSGYKLPDGLSPLEASLRERRLEFCYEFCMRWLDMTRIQKGFSRLAIDKTDGSSYTLKDGDFRFAMPIPQKAELTENPIVQNPGWNNF